MNGTLTYYGGGLWRGYLRGGSQGSVDGKFSYGDGVAWGEGDCLGTSDGYNVAENRCSDSQYGFGYGLGSSRSYGNKNGTGYGYGESSPPIW